MAVAAEVLRAVAAPRRRAILRLVWDAEASAGAIHERLGDVSFGAVSQHLGALADLGLVERRVEGRHRYYRARPEALGSLRGWLEEMWGDALHELKLQAELEEARRGPMPGARRGPRKRKGTR